MTSTTQNDRNRQRYESEEVVSHYIKQSALQPCEAYLFQRYVKPGLDILDIGVGGGRTTPHLARDAERYVGADYSKAMVEACQRRFPDLEFRHCDATQMSEFADGEFDAVIFSFNGIDTIGSDVERHRCFAEIARILKPQGLFLFSSHNARQIGEWPQITSAIGYQVPWRIIRSLVTSPIILARLILSGAFWSGCGYVFDPYHGGLHSYVSTPKTIRPQIEAVGMNILETVGGHYPCVKAEALSPWHYYACVKSTAN